MRQCYGMVEGACQRPQHVLTGLKAGFDVEEKLARLAGLAKK